MLNVMYLAIDIGGSKTLLACFNKQGELMETLKFPTPKKYPEFLKTLKESCAGLKHAKQLKSACMAVPGLLDRDKGEVIALSNLPWKNKPIQIDVAKLLAVPVLMENDSKLAGLSEAILLKRQFSHVMYITISTGIGIAVVDNGKLVASLIDSEAGNIIVEKDGKRVEWQRIASGKAITERYGKMASEITSEITWRAIVKDITLGLYDLIAIIQPDVVVVGGGVGAHFNKFGDLLIKELHRVGNPMVPIPPIKGAQRPEEAVVYGCYHLLQS